MKIGKRSEFKDEDIAIIAKTFSKFFKKSNEQRKLKNFKNQKEKKEAIICPKCKKPRCIKSECPLLNKVKKKAMVAMWDDSDEETSYKEKSYEVSNLALMAIGDELDEVNNLSSHDELFKSFT